MTSTAGYQYGSSGARASAGRRQPLAPPLPLVRFQLGKEAIAVGPKTINREDLRSIPNDLNGDKVSQADKLHDPIASRKLARWFVARSQKEVNYRQTEMFTKQVSEIAGEDYPPLCSLKGDLYEYTIYESLMHVESKEERLRRNEKRMSEEQVHVHRYHQQIATFDRRKKNVRKFSDSKATPPFPSAHTEQNPSSNILEKANMTDSEPDGNLDGDDDHDSVNSSNSDSSSERDSGISSRRESPLPCSPTISYTPSLLFDAEFESGNLEKVVRVIGRETLLTPKALEHVQEYQVPDDADQEYDLTLRNDIYTDGNIQWYYFCATIDPESQGMTFPMKVRFNIVNMQKKDSLYNYGMKPAVLSINENHGSGKDWFHHGYDICYYKNGLNQIQSKLSQKEKRKKVIRNNYTLTFSYVFEKPDTVYFAHTFPYTYSDLQRYLLGLETKLSSSEFFHRRILCETIAGNKCDILTVTERAEGVLESKSKPAVIISARVHPGECNSSYMIQGFIDFLCSDSAEAQKLRKAFVFTIVPMLNPDGVIHGNYRCSLAGTDLNRRFGDANEAMHPTVVAMKEMIKNIRQHRTVALYLDLHGHSRHKNSFVYGCDIAMQPDKVTQVILSNLPEDDINALRIHSRVFPKILCTLSKASNGTGYFSFRDCAFRVQKSKMGTGRVVCWRDMSILGSYTIEASFCGNGDNSEFSSFKRHFDSGFTRSSKMGQNTMNVNEDIIKEEVEETPSTKKSFFSGVDSYLSKPDIDPRFHDILAGYKTSTHYQKRDLYSMGKHIAQAVYHFSNLTHADLSYELEQLRAQNELELKSRSSSSQGFRGAANQSIVYGHASSSKTTDDLYSPSGRSTTTLSPQAKYAPPKGIAFVSLPIVNKPSFGPTLAMDKDLDNNYSNEPRTECGTDNIEDEDIDENDNEDVENESASECSGDDCNKRKDDQQIRSRGSSRYNSKALAAAAAKAAIEEVVAKYRGMKVEIYESKMIGRLLPHCGIFGVDSIQSSLQSYCNEYTFDRSTKNVGLRLKCELALRRALKLDTDLNLERLIALENEANHPPSDDDEVELGSADGSDSDPSVDNQNAAKMLKNMKRFKDTNSLVAALRSALAKKKKKEDELSKKQEKKMMARLAKQAEQARKQQQESDKAQEKAQLASKKKSLLTAGNSQKDKTFRTQSLSAPKHGGPMYRLAPELKVNVPVQIKMMGFKDYDPGNNTPTPKRGTMGTGRRQTYSTNPLADPTGPSAAFFANANPNIANILGFNNNGKTVIGSDNLVDLLPGLGVQPESGLFPSAKEDTPFAAALRLKNAIAHNRDDDHTASFANSGSGKHRVLNRVGTEKARPTTAPSVRKPSNFSSWEK